MKRILVILWTIIGLLCLQSSGAWAIESSFIGIASAGRITSTSTYFSFGVGGEKPAFENRYSSSYFASGPVGLGMTGAFDGGLTTQEKLEVQPGGFGRFETKAGTGVLINTVNADTGVISGTLKMNAVGFGGDMSSGIVAAGFETADGLVGTAESEGVGCFRAGGIQTIMTGTSQGTEPVTIDHFSQHFSIGPGPYQVQVRISFP